MSQDPYLPPGCRVSDLPGNRPEDERWERALEEWREDIHRLHHVVPKQGKLAYEAIKLWLCHLCPVGLDAVLDEDTMDAHFDDKHYDPSPQGPEDGDR